MADRESNSVDAVYREMWGAVAEAEAMVEVMLRSTSDGTSMDILTEGCLRRVTEAVHAFDQVLRASGWSSSKRRRRPVRRSAAAPALLGVVS